MSGDVFRFCAQPGFSEDEGFADALGWQLQVACSISTGNVETQSADETL